MSEIKPVTETQRIESLDVLRGFALLGILLLNIIGFGLLSPSYSNPGFDLVGASSWNIATYVGIELLAEGAMRGLFSILFGAGIVLFASGESGKGAWLHYKRTFWLMVFGLINAYLLLWNGDILVTYALAGAVLFLFRNLSPRSLAISAGLFFVLISLVYAGLNFGLSEARVAAEQVTASDSQASLPEELRRGAEAWHDFESDWDPDQAAMSDELAARRGSYGSAFKWNLVKNEEVYTLLVPLFLFWDALAMMLLGMSLYKYGVLRGDRSSAFYIKLMTFGFLVGVSFNSYEIYRAIASNFDILETFAQLQWSYHFGRLGLSVGYIGLLLSCINSGLLAVLKARLAAVGRMALTNYLLQSFICGLIFTGAGFALLGELERFELYPVVIAIWIFQLWISPLWLRYYRFGPAEWLWRALTYGQVPPMQR
ncbi:MAG: DUF418 domain-containing protein [Pseudomonadota bacterium]|nr:DUF418 domain-containing protein [Pseudomonadota bacterium]